MDFKQWLTSRQQEIHNYRHLLNTVVRTMREICEGCIVEQKHVDIGIEALRRIPMPVMGKYPGTVTEEDKQYYLNNTPIPPKQWLAIAEAEVRGLLTATPESVTGGEMK
jgi:hypothetical protein